LLDIVNTAAGMIHYPRTAARGPDCHNVIDPGEITVARVFVSHDSPTEAG